MQSLALDYSLTHHSLVLPSWTQVSWRFLSTLRHSFQFTLLHKKVTRLWICSWSSCWTPERLGATTVNNNCRFNFSLIQRRGCTIRKLLKYVKNSLPRIWNTPPNFILFINLKKNGQYTILPRNYLGKHEEQMEVASTFSWWCMHQWANPQTFHTSDTQSKWTRTTHKCGHFIWFIKCTAKDPRWNPVSLGLWPYQLLPLLRYLHPEIRVPSPLHFPQPERPASSMAMPSWLPIRSPLPG